MQKSRALYISEYGQLGRLGLPVLVTQLGIITVSFADTMMVGAYGLNELAAAAFVNSFFLVPMVMLIGFAAGMTPLIGAMYGKKDYLEAGATFRAGFQMNLFMSLSFTAIMGVMYFFLDRFGQPVELLPLIRSYYLIILCSVVPLALFNCCQQTSNGSTVTSMPMWIILGCNVLNIVGNWILINGKFGAPELGLAGAGFSTLMSRVVGTLVILSVFRFSSRWESYRAGWRKGNRLGEKRVLVWKTSYPVMIQSGVECFLWTLGAIVAGWYGKVQLAAYQVVNTISQLGFMTYMSFSTATSIIVANETGRRNITGVRRTAIAGLHLNLVLGTIASVLFLLFTRPLIHLFTPDAEVIEAAMLLIVPLILYQYGDAVQLTYANALRGTSHVKPLLWISVVSYIVVGVPALLFLGDTLKLMTMGIYYSFSAALFSASVLLWWTFRKVVNTL